VSMEPLKDLKIRDFLKNLSMHSLRSSSLRLFQYLTQISRSTHTLHRSFMNYCSSLNNYAFLTLILPKLHVTSPKLPSETRLYLRTPCRHCALLAPELLKEKKMKLIKYHRFSDLTIKSMFIHERHINRKIERNITCIQ
jgi:hypothetical protein